MTEPGSRVCAGFLEMEPAAQAGARFDEILEARDVAIAMGGGRATVSARFALAVLDSPGLPRNGGTASRRY